MKLKVGKVNYYEGDINVVENKVNIILGKNNIGKTSLLDGIANSNSKEYSVYFLNLNTNPFEDLIKQPSDITKEKINNSYVDIKNKFIDYNLDEKTKAFKDKFIKFIDFKNKQKTWNKELDIKNKYGVTIDIDESQLEIILKKPLIFKGVSFDKTKHSIKNVGLGHLRIVMLEMLKKIIVNDKKVILLIDEPETFLHPTLIKSFCKIIRNMIKTNKNITVILTTHSPYVLAELKDYLLYFRFAHYNHKTQKLEFNNLLDKKEIVDSYKKIVKNYYSEDCYEDDSEILSNLTSMLTFDFCRMFFADKIIGVEGISEMFVFSFENFNDGISKLIGEHEVIPFYGLDNLSKAYTLFLAFNKKFIMLCDHDKKDNCEDGKNYKKLSNLLAKDYTEIVILEKGEIEDELGIGKVDFNSRKPENILKNMIKIDTVDNIKKFSKYFKKLR